MHPIRYVKIYHKNNIKASYRRFGELWEDTNDSGVVIDTKVLCEILEKYANMSDVTKVIIDDMEYDKEILRELY